ncbi:HAD domain-containing protein [Segatella copri]|uniref:HAD domain-containing protein n=1 Tax=Segatella copri TaxID=165179 RepID=A0AAW5TYP6_9BACT|nr:HAD domain-containing protein [Segatella copri]MCW4093888.1 HAD domain-containing protein [Segatella copri]
MILKMFLLWTISLWIFDGLHQRQLLYERKAWQDKYGTCFDPEAVKQLQTIVDMTHADIVIESSWKYLGLEAMQDMWKDRQLPGKVIGITPSAISDNILLSTDLDVLDSSMLHCKGAEIASWLHENNMQEVPYVIIDDEYVILESQLPHFILTNPYDGIIEELAMRAIGILNRQ